MRESLSDIILLLYLRNSESSFMLLFKNSVALPHLSKIFCIRLIVYSTATLALKSTFFLTYERITDAHSEPCQTHVG